MSKKLTPSDIVILAAGIVLLVASFLPWLELADFDLSESAWDHFPGFVYPAIAGVAAGLLVALRASGTLSGNGLLGVTWTQIYWILGGWATLSVLAIALEDTDVEFLGVGSFGPDKGVGIWLSLLAAIALLVGAYLSSRESAQATTETPTA